MPQQAQFLHRGPIEPMKIPPSPDADMRYIRSRLLKWYRQEQRPLPWRRTKDPYAIWVSEVMLQQTQVNTVIPYYQRFLRRFPTIENLAAAREEEVLKLWEGLGYYARARNLHRAAGTIVADLGGQFPTEKKEFQKLKGVGEYIASAVLSIAFGQPHAVVDGNVKRVLARLLMIDAAANQPAALKTFNREADRLLDPKCPGTANQALMELGALICRPSNPLCSACPVKMRCRAFGAGRVDAYPKRIARGAVPEHHIAVGVIFRKGRVLITRRPSDGLLGGLWEFPGGKVRYGETPEQACVREIKEEVDLNVVVEEHIARVRHAYTHFRIVMDVYRCRCRTGTVRLKTPTAFRWIRLDEFEKYPFPKANHKFMPLLKGSSGEHFTVSKPL